MKAYWRQVTAGCTGFAFVLALFGAAMNARADDGYGYMPFTLFKVPSEGCRNWCISTHFDDCYSKVIYDDQRMGQIAKEDTDAFCTNKINEDCASSCLRLKKRLKKTGKTQCDSYTGSPDYECIVDGKVIFIR